MNKLPGLALIFLLGVIGLPCAQADEAAAAAGMAETPQLRVQTLDGTAFDLTAHRGKWVVINYWATWCSPCLKEMPDLDAFAKKREDVVLIGLAYEDIEIGEMREFLNRHPVSYPIAIVDVFEPPAAFPAPRGLPMTWLIGPDGRVAKQFLGPVTGRDLEQAMAAGQGS